MILECVILLHGLARTDASMNLMESSLEQSGYQIVNHTYPSREKTIEELAKEVPVAVSQCPENSAKIHFVTHSMGGLLLRQHLQAHTIDSLDKVVMLGPPNNGSEIVDELGQYDFYKVINGPAGLQMGTSKQSVPNSLGAWPENAGDLGVIAGEKSINLFLSYLIPDKDDGKVSVESTKLEGMADHKVMATTHPMMMRNKKVIEQVKLFLKNGEFTE